MGMLLLTLLHLSYCDDQTVNNNSSIAVNSSGQNLVNNSIPQHLIGQGDTSLDSSIG